MEKHKEKDKERIIADCFYMLGESRRDASEVLSKLQAEADRMHGLWLVTGDLDVRGWFLNRGRLQEYLDMMDRAFAKAEEVSDG